MNGKAAKRIRAIAKQKSHSWKETTTQGAKMVRMDSILADPRATNIKDGIFIQRLLHHMSVGFIAKKLKRLFKATPRPERFGVFGAFSQLINTNPELLGIKV